MDETRIQLSWLAFAPPHESLRPRVTLTDTDRPTAATDAWAVVMGRTPRGDSEVERPVFPLSRAQRELLSALDGRHSLRELITAQPAMASARLSRDAARLLAFGLVKQLRGELPRDIVVASMNLTMRLPADAFRHLGARNAPRTAPAPVQGKTPARPKKARAAAGAGRHLWLATGLMLFAAAATAAWWLH